MSNRSLFHCLRVLFLPASLLIAACADEPTGLPGTTYPVRYSVDTATGFTDINAVVRFGDRWIEIDSFEIPQELIGVIPTHDIPNYGRSWFEVTLLTNALWSQTKTGYEPLSYRWENNRFVFVNPDRTFGTIYGYGDSDEFTVPMIMFFNYSEKKGRGFDGDDYYEQEQPPYVHLNLEDFQTDGSDTLYYRTFQLVMHPYP
jgi:hypothetical protein